MQHKLIGILSLLFASFLFAVPASAAELPQCAVVVGDDHFVIIAQDNIIFEVQSANSGRIINGNVLVTSTTIDKPGNNTGTGFAKVGANTHIVGSLIAKEIILPDAGAKIDNCIADIFVANTAAAKASCTTGFHASPNTDFTNYATAHPGCTGSTLGALALCGPAPTANLCANSASDLVVDKGANVSPVAGCYGALKCGQGAVVNLSGTYMFKSMQLASGCKLLGPATVDVNNGVVADPGVTLTSITLNIAAATSAEVFSLFNNGVLNGTPPTVVNAPFGKCHLHTGSDLADCSEACCKVQDVEPITAECVIVGEVCRCPDGFVFEVDPNSTDPDSKLKRSCVAK